MPEAAPIQVCRVPGKFAWIRVEGKGDLNNSPRLLSFAQCVIAKGDRRLVVDLEDCPVMDSTFMGTLTGLARMLRDGCNGEGDGGGELEVINANERNRELIENLGLDYILSLDVEGTAWGAEREEVSRKFRESAVELEPENLSKEEKTEFILRAHENLTEANPENLLKFEDVIRFLRAEAEGGNA